MSSGPLKRLPGSFGREEFEHAHAIVARLRERLRELAMLSASNITLDRGERVTNEGVHVLKALACAIQYVGSEPVEEPLLVQCPTDTDTHAAAEAIRFLNARVVSSGSTVSLPDLTRHFAGDIWVRELDAASYLGVPFFGVDGTVTGVVSVIGARNRVFNEEDEWWLRIAAQLVGDSFAYKTLAREMRDLERVLQPNLGEPAEEEASEPEVRQPTLLVVDDDRQVNDFLTDFLKMEGYNVESAFNGVEAVETFHPVKHSMVISDVAMPLMNGWELTAVLRVRAPSLPIVLVSGYSTGEVNKEYLAKQGVSAVLRKPLDLQELSDLVNRLVPLTA